MFSITVQLTKPVSNQLWDEISGHLYLLGSIGIDEGEEAPPEGEDAFVAGTEFSSAIHPGNLTPPKRFISYFQEVSGAEEAKTLLTNLLRDFSPQFEIQKVTEQDYTAKWRESVEPIEVGPDWLILAPWHTRKPSWNQVPLLIEPGMAFGTGSHETTRSCLMMLAQKDVRKKLASATQVLDFGCGSGILAIAMKKLTDANVVGIDIDPLSVEATEKNALANGVELTASLHLQEGATYDVIVANILKNTLLEFAPRFLNWLKPNSLLILSGLLEAQVPAILETYTALGFVEKHRILLGSPDRWATLLLQKA